MKKKSGFEKFQTLKKSGAALKEEIRQEKKKITRERKEYFENKRVEARAVATGEKLDPALNRPKIIRAVEAQMPLNKYIAHSGICSRRDAAEVVKSGKVKVNGEVVVEPGFKISPTDTVVVNGKKAFPVKDLVYILLNKPKDYITTTDDERSRKTVLDLIKNASKEKVYPVGRLDRNT
jgi:23S rRNA pseudouridine2605 synthase